MADEKPTATVYYFGSAHAGPGWYYVDDEYPDEGSCGAFDTEGEAVEHAKEGGYAVSVSRIDPWKKRRRRAQ